MIIQCTSCEKKFNVPDAAITSAGRLVQCSSCGNKWTQYPIKAKSIVSKKIPKPSIPISPKNKKTKKRTSPVPYSKEYMEQKWGTSVQSYAKEKGLSKELGKSKKTQKRKSSKSHEKSGYGFFNYVITFSVLSIFLVGILNFERSRITRKFPVLEPYIDHFFESLEIFKIFILDFFR